MIIYTIPGNPVALARPRLCKHGIFDSQKLDKLNAGLFLRHQHGNLPIYSHVPLHIEAIFYMNMPKSSRRQWDTLRGGPHKVRPDVDNLVKFLLDICNGIILNDDCIISSLSARKIYDDDPRTEFSLHKLD